jgi:capsular exopolysaccharide synthesis family protein
MGKITRALQKATQDSIQHIEKAVKIKEYEQMIVHKLKDSKLDARLVAYFDPKAIISEQYKILTTNVLSLNKGKPPKTIAITSSVAGEGKTVSALNFAITMSHATHKPRIVLIDADMRKGQLLNYLGAPPRKGLSEFLQGDATLEEILFSLDDIDHLSFIASGAVPSNPADLLASVRMKELITALRDKYNFVLIDTPPVIPVTDAVIIGSCVEGVLLVIKAGDTQRGMVSRAIELLVQAHSNIIGHVLTGVEYFIPEYIYRYL